MNLDQLLIDRNAPSVRNGDVGRILVASVAMLLPVNCSWLDYSVDRTNMLTGDTLPLMPFGFEISLDGGLTWGGNFATGLKYFSLNYSGGASGEPIPPQYALVLQADSRIGMELPQPENANRLIRAWYQPLRAGIAPGIKFTFSDPPVIDIAPADHHSVAENSTTAAQVFSSLLGTTGVTFSATVNNSNTLALCGVGWVSLVTDTATSTWDNGGANTSMPAVGTGAISAVMEGSLPGSAIMFALAGVGNSSTSVKVAWNTSTVFGALGLVGYDGVDQTTPTSGVQTDVKTSSDTTSVTVTTGATGDMVGAIKVGDSGTIAGTTDGTSRWAGLEVGGRKAGQQDKAGGASIAIGWSGMGVGGHSAMQGCNIAQVSVSDVLRAQAVM